MSKHADIGLDTEICDHSAALLSAAVTGQIDVRGQATLEGDDA